MERITARKSIKEYERQFPMEEYFGFDIRPYTSVVRFEPEEVIVQEGTLSPNLYFCISGRAKLFLTHKNGTVTLINFLESPCFIGEMELLDEEKASEGVAAITGCICFLIETSACREKLLNDVKFLRYLCGFLSKKAIGNTYNYSKNQTYPLKVRLASFILMTSHGGLYRERHTEAAGFLGVTYRHLLYVLAELVRDGILEKTPAGYRIRDKEALRGIADAE